MASAVPLALHECPRSCCRARCRSFLAGGRAVKARGYAVGTSEEDALEHLKAGAPLLDRVQMEELLRESRVHKPSLQPWLVTITIAPHENLVWP